MHILNHAQWCKSTVGQVLLFSEYNLKLFVKKVINTHEFDLSHL